MSALKVTIVSTQRGWHGGEAQAELLARGLRQRGHQVSVLARRSEAFAARMADAGFPVETFGGRGRNPLALWQIRRNLSATRPDLLFANDAHALTAGGIASVGLHLPARLAARRVDFPLRSASRYLHGCDRVVCVSTAVARVCGEAGIPADRLSVVHDGVDPARIATGERARGRRSLGLADDQPLLLTVAKLTDHKGHRFLLAALPSVIKHFPRAVAAFAGDGELTDSLKNQARTLGIEAHVRFLGYRDDIPDLLLAADLFVAPSHLEGLNTSIIDAMLAARPIVTTTAGGIPDLVGSDTATGGPVAWLAPPRDPAALAEQLLAALRSPRQAQLLAELAKRRALERFTADAMVEGTLAVYREIVDQRKRRAA